VACRRKELGEKEKRTATNPPTVLRPYVNTSYIWNSTYHNCIVYLNSALQITNTASDDLDSRFLPPFPLPCLRFAIPTPIRTRVSLWPNRSSSLPRRQVHDPQDLRALPRVDTERPPAQIRDQEMGFRICSEYDYKRIASHLAIGVHPTIEERKVFQQDLAQA